MDPRRPHAAPAAHGSANGTCALRLKRLELFQQVEPETPRSNAHGHGYRTLDKRKSLSTMEFASPRSDASDIMFTITPSSTYPSSPVQTAKAAAPMQTTPASDFLQSIRSKTLLDYQFMREFSLAKRKPVSERNLSRMSASSVYSMRMAQMELATKGRQLQHLPKTTTTHNSICQVAGSATSSQASTKSDGETRDASLLAAATSTTSATRPHMHVPFRRGMTTTTLTQIRHEIETSDHSVREQATACFPTLWKPDEQPATLATKYRSAEHVGVRHQSLPAAVTAYQVSEETANASGKGKTQGSHHRNTVSNGPIISSDLSEFDMRKCHPTATVTSQHGFLQDQDLQKLVIETGYDRTELYALWARFKALCSLAKSPRGIDKDTFRRGIPQLSVEDHFFIDRVFDILDADGSGILEWQEFVEVLSSLEKGDVENRVEFLFRVYDLNGDGSIHRNEVMQFFLASLLVKPTDDLVDVAKHFVGQIFEAVGCREKDSMRVDDALRYMREHPSSDIYSLFGRTMVTNRTKLDVSKWEVVNRL